MKYIMWGIVANTARKAENIKVNDIFRDIFQQSLLSCIIR